MALGRLDMPGLVLYNGTIYPGMYKGQRRDDRHGVRGDRRLSGRQDRARGALRGRERAPAPGAGACGGQFTANTMAMVLEFLGPLAGAASTASRPRTRRRTRRRGGPASSSMTLVRHDIRPSQHRDPRVDRERDRRDRRDRRLDERRAPPAGHRPRVRHPAGHRRVRRDRRSDADRGRHAARAAATRRRTCTTPAGSRWSCASS